MIAENKNKFSFGFADLSPLGRKAVYRMGDLDPTAIMCALRAGCSAFADFVVNFSCGKTARTLGSALT